MWNWNFSFLIDSFSDSSLGSAMVRSSSSLCSYCYCINGMVEFVLILIGSSTESRNIEIDWTENSRYRSAEVHQTQVPASRYQVQSKFDLNIVTQLPWNSILQPIFMEASCCPIKYDCSLTSNATAPSSDVNKLGNHNQLDVKRKNRSNGKALCSIKMFDIAFMLLTFPLRGRMLWERQALSRGWKASVRREETLRNVLLHQRLPQMCREKVRTDDTRLHPESA